MNPDFLKPLTPSILIAAEGCPVEVIKFETKEVEGPAPWPKEGEGEPAGAGEPSPVLILDGCGKLRHPRFLGLRADKSPKDVVRERPS